MGIKVKTVTVCILGLSAAVFGFISGYNYLSGISDEVERIQAQDIENAEVVQLQNKMLSKSRENNIKIQPDTKMVYKYYYPNEGKTEILERAAPYFLYNDTKNNLEAKYTDWKVEAFSTDEVVLSKQIEPEENKYIVKEYNDFIAVFYNKGESEKILKEVTLTPITSLPPEEQELLRKGIPVKDDDELIKVLSDYES